MAKTPFASALTSAVLTSPTVTGESRVAERIGSICTGRFGLRSVLRPGLGRRLSPRLGSGLTTMLIAELALVFSPASFEAVRPPHVVERTAHGTASGEHEHIGELNAHHHAKESKNVSEREVKWEPKMRTAREDKERLD